MPKRYHSYSWPGKGKTKFSLSGEGRTWYGEFDVGSYARAMGEYAPPEIEVHQFHPPIDLLNRGHVSTAMAGRELNGPVFVARRLEGWSELALRFLVELAAGLESREFSNFVFDTQTKLYDIAQNDYQQRIQDEVTEDRERLQRAEYNEVKKFMEKVINAPVMYGANTILTSHMKEQWRGGKPTGDYIPDGWNKVDDFSDCTMEFVIEDGKVHGIVKKGSGLGGLYLKDLRVEEPTIPLMQDLMDAAAKLVQAGKAVPRDAMGIIVAAAKE